MLSPGLLYLIPLTLVGKETVKIMSIGEKKKNNTESLSKSSKEQVRGSAKQYLKS